MVSVNNNVTTEYDYKKQIVQNAGKVSAPNSVYNEVKSQNSEETAQTVESELDKILEKICEKFKKYGITIEDLKRNPMIQKASQIPANVAAKASKEEKIKVINTYVQCLEAALKDSINKDGRIDIEKANKLSNDYFVAVETGWKIEEYKEWNSKNECNSLFEKLVKDGYLPEGSTKENTSEKQIKIAIKRNCRKLFRQVKHNPKQKEIQEQLKTFGTYVINSPDDEKEMLLEVVEFLYSKNRFKAVETTIASCCPKIKKAVAKHAGEPEYLKKITSQPLCDENGVIIEEAMSQDETIALAKCIFQNQTEEDRAEGHEAYNTARLEWFKNNKQTLESIQQKIAKAEAEGVEAEFTEAEKQVLTEQKNFINGVSAGEFLGTINGEFSEEFKKSHLAALNADAYETPAYKDILQNVNNYVKMHENEFSMPVAKVEEILNKATDKNYNRVANGSSEELKAPAAKNTENADNTPDLGFRSRENVNTSNLANLKQKINKTEEKTQFRVEKTTSESEIIKTNKNFKDIINNAPDCEKSTVVQRLYETNAAFKSAIETFVRLSSTPIIVLNYLPSSIRADLAKDLFALGKIDEADVTKLNLSFDQNKAVLSLSK